MAVKSGGAGGMGASSVGRSISLGAPSATVPSYSSSSRSSSSSSSSSGTSMARAYANSIAGAEAAARRQELARILQAQAEAEQLKAQKAALIKRVQAITAGNSPSLQPGEAMDESYDGRNPGIYANRNSGGPIDESYDYTQPAASSNNNYSRYMNRNKETSFYTQPQIDKGYNEQLLNEIRAKLEKALTEASNIKTSYNSYVPNMPTVAEQVSTIASSPISTQGDTVIPGLGLLNMQSENEAFKSEAALNDYIATTNAQMNKASAVNDALQGLSDLLGTLMADENADQAFALNQSNSDFANEQTAIANALARILEGTGSQADYALLGIDPGTMPYAQQNFLDTLNLQLAQLANEQRKTELYGLGLTV